MRDTTIARNYADALLTLARKANDPRGWGRLIQDVADSILFIVSERASFMTGQILRPNGGTAMPW